MPTVEKLEALLHAIAPDQKRARARHQRSCGVLLHDDIDSSATGRGGSVTGLATPPRVQMQNAATLAMVLPS